MKNSLKNKLLIPFFLLIQSSCSSAQYKIHQQLYERTGIIISSDRIILECEDQYAGGGDFKDTFAFLIYFLDEEKTVSTAFQSTIMDQSECSQKLKLAESILRKSKQVYIAGIMDLNEPRVIDQKTYHFPKFGDYHGNGRSMQWNVLKGEDGTCVTAYDGDGKPCPWDPIFPAETVPFSK